MQTPLIYETKEFRPYITGGDPVIEAARLEREIMRAIHERIAASQCGEAFAGLDTSNRNS